MIISMIKIIKIKVLFILSVIEHKTLYHGGIKEKMIN